MSEAGDPDDVRPEEGLTVTVTQLRWLKAGAVLLGVIVLAFLVSWGYLAVRASRVPALEARVAELTEREARVEALASRLEEVETAYGRLRSLFGTGAADASGELWLPPTASAGAARGRADATGGDLPSAWPLTEAGFLTQDLLEDPQAGHPGIDVAVPVGSYVRASGPGTVLETGDDPVYGRFVVLEHGDGYRSRYAHNSAILADVGAVVRRGEVIALSGSSGRSTAPHLHFEILRGDSLVDPLSMVSPP